MNFLSVWLHFLYCFALVCKMGVREKVDVFDYQLGKIQIVLIHVLSMNPVYFLLFDRAGKLAYKIALGTTRYLHKEKNYVVWRVALSNLNYMNKILSNRASYSLFKVGALSSLYTL